MKLFKSLKVSTKIIIVTAFLAIFFLAMPVVFILLNIRDQLIEQSLFSLQSEVDAESSKINAVIYEVSDTMFSLTSTPPIQGMFRALENDGFDELENSSYQQWKNRLALIFSSEINNTKFYDQLRYIDENGQEIVRVNMVNSQAVIVPEEKLQNKANRPYFQEAMKLDAPQLYVSSVELNREGQPPEIEKPYKPVIRYAVPVFDEQGNKRGIIIANVLFESIMNRAHFLSTQRTFFYLADSNGYFLVHTNDEKLWGSPIDLDTGENLQNNFSNISDSVFEVTSGFYYDKNYVYSYSRSYPNPQSRDYYWITLKKLPINELFASINKLINFVFLLTFFVFIIAFIAFIYGIKKILSPLNDLSMMAKMIGEGNFNKRVEIDTNDEIGFLANTLNTSAKKLNDSYYLLEKKVNDKTKDLQKNVEELEKSQLSIAHVLEHIKKEKTKFNILADDLKKFKLAVERVSEHIIITDPEGVIIYANKACENITGYSRNELIGKTPSLWGGQMDKSFYENFWKTIKEKKKIFIGEINNRRKNGEIYSAAIQIAPILDDSGKILFYVGIERDITKEKEIDRAKTEFVSLASHQLRTPLTAINWYAEMLLDEDAGKLNREQRDFVREIYDGNQRMVILVNALLNVSRIDLGTFAIEPKLTDLKKLVLIVLKDLMSQIEIKKIKLTKKYCKDLPNVNVDPGLMTIIFQNLLSNAVKYTPENGKVSLSIEIKQKDILIKVGDTGYGIPEKDQKKIFEKLYRADNVQKMDVEGTGLGLYIVKSIVEQGGGKIWFESKEGKGTTFYITIPLSGMKSKKGTRGLSAE